MVKNSKIIKYFFSKSVPHKTLIVVQVVNELFQLFELFLRDKHFVTFSPFA